MARPLKWACRQWIFSLLAANTALAVGPVKIQPAATPGRFLLAWDATAGRSYVVEASDDLADWDEVTRVAALASRLNSVEIALPGPKTFWRVRELGGAPAVSPVRATYTLTGDQSAALLSLTTGDEPPLSKVEFFSDGLRLGEAEPGPDNTWSFAVLTGEHPEIRDIHAEVTGEDGNGRLVPAARFLLADPTRFVPAGPAGERRFGELVQVDGAGKFGAFYFYPEGVSDGQRESGAFFAFSAGAATLTGTAENAALDFTSAAFHRGPQDGDPLASGANPSPLRLASITPQEVNRSFGRDPDEPIDLQFGGVAVKWEQGALGPDGWSGLKVKIPIGDFLLPGNQLDTEVVIGPGNSLDSLVVTYAGDWRPLAEGPEFEVPLNDPLRLYLNGRGEIRARGSVIARLANGGSLRGTVSWSPPYFEIHLEGRKIIVPSLGALRGVLPTGSESVVNNALGDGSAEALAAAEATLRGFQQTLAQTARAAAEQSPESAPVGALVPASDARASAAALAAWAARLSTWAADRSGQTLDAGETADLTETIKNAANAAKGAGDLGLVASVWSDLTAIDSHKSVAGTGGAATTLAAAVSSSLAELLAVRERLASGALPQDLELLANHQLPDYGDAAGGPPGGIPPEGPVIGATPPATRERDVATREVDRKAEALFGTLRVPATGPADPSAVAALDLPARLSALATLADVFARQGRIFPGRTIDSPELAQYRVTFDVLADGIEPALAASRAAAIEKGDFAAIQLALSQQLEFATSHRTLTGAPPVFDPEIIDLMDASVAALEAAILRTPPRKRQALATGHMQLLGGIVAVSQSPEVGVFLATLLDRLSASGDQFRALVSGSPDCDELLQALKASTGIPFKPLRSNSHPLADGAAAQLAISGTYESTGGHGGKSYTLQLNRAGQYLLGRMQEHEPRRQTKSWELEGLMLGDETAAGVRFSCLRYSGNSGVKSVLLEALPVADGMNVSVTTSPEGQVVNFQRTSTRPFYSPQFSGRMNGEVKSVFDASIRAPLHRDQQARIARNINELHFALLEWDQFRNSSQTAVKRGIADAIDSACTRLLSDVSRDQIPLLRQFTRSRLSGFAEQPNAGTNASTPLAQRLQPLQAGQKTQWTLLLEIFRDRGTLVNPSVPGDAVLTSCAQLLTGESLPDAGAPVYTYKCQINKTTVGVPIPVPISVAGGGITFEITRSQNGQIEETIYLAGLFTQAGGGVPLGMIADFLGRFSGGTGGDEVIVTSHVRYTEADLSGAMVFGSAGAMGTTFGLGTTPGSNDIAISRGVGGIILAGPLALNKPPLILPLPFKSGSQEIGLGLEATVGIGGVASFSAFNGEVDIFAARLQPLKGPARRSFELGQQTVFATGSSEITDCGWTQLRQFVAEYRAIFDDPAAKITIISLTDTVGTDASNELLAEQRNFSVLSALSRILGRVPGSDDSPVRMLPLGEQAARSDLPLPAGLNATEAALLNQMRGELGTRPEGSPQSVAGWRVVKVLLNNTIYFDLNSL